jgi:CelD/BcsL family acetyltransferase involved in cellulose biosynthesis
MPAEERAACRAVLLHSAAGELQAVFPFRMQQDRYWGPPVSGLDWAFGDLGCPDHLDLLASPTADFDALTGVLETLPWVAMRLDHVAEGAAGVERLCEACAGRGWRVERWPQGRCLYLDLPESWDAYLSGLSAHARHAIRRKERRLRREHDVTVIEYGAERLEEGLQHLQRLHALRWSGAGGGSFREPVMQRLHHGMAATLAERGELWLVTLDLDGTPAAAWYGFAHGDTVYHYQSGRDPRWERERVGTVLVGLMIRRAIERGYRRLDFLRGEEPYKTEWTQTARSNYQFTVFRRGWRGAVLRRLDRIQRPLRGKGLRQPVERLYQWLGRSSRRAEPCDEAVGEERVHG